MASRPAQSEIPFAFDIFTPAAELDANGWVIRRARPSGR
jgi:hypothetical protein